MSHEYPSKVLITGGREVGGVTSFAEGLCAGFTELGVSVEIVPPSGVFRRWRDLRNPRILKILGTSAIFAAPLARRAICVAHGFPCAAHQGWVNTLAKLASYRMATASRGAQFVPVSDYSALHLHFIFNLRVDAVIRNPLHPLFIEEANLTNANREALVFVGRLHQAKNVDLLLPAMLDVLDENPGLRAWIIGDGPTRPQLERIAAGDSRIEFLGSLEPVQVRERLRRSCVFVSGCPHEALGIAYIEALSQGCAVAMPASGGGLEIAPELIGKQIQLFPVAEQREAVAAALGAALRAESTAVSLARYSPRAVAEAYLAVDARFSAKGDFRAVAAT
jgi:glycosyltransferase involved in cell wall biosynthesis